MATSVPYIGPAAAAVLTPIIMVWLQKRFPAKPLDPNLDVAVFRHRNGWIDNVATLLIFVGICTTLPVARHMDYLSKEYSVTFAIAVFGLAFSMAVFLPIFWICLVTLPHGKDRLLEFFAFYQYRWKIGPIAVLLTLSPFIAIGMVSFAAIASSLLLELLSRLT